MKISLVVRVGVRPILPSIGSDAAVHADSSSGQDHCLTLALIQELSEVRRRLSSREKCESRGRSWWCMRKGRDGNSHHQMELWLRCGTARDFMVFRSVTWTSIANQRGFQRNLPICPLQSSALRHVSPGGANFGSYSQQICARGIEHIHA